MTNKEFIATIAPIICRVAKERGLFIKGNMSVDDILNSKYMIR